MAGARREPDELTEVTWADGVAQVRGAFGSYGPNLAGLVDRAVGEQWIDAGARPGKSGGAFCMRFTGDRSLVLLNWSGSADSVRTLAHAGQEASARRIALETLLADGG